MMLQAPRALGTAVMLLVVLGCGKPGTAPTVPVTGTVTLNGQPVEGVSVGFTPQSGRPASDTTDARGKFTLSTFESGDGAVPGTHKVVITEPADEAEPMPGTPEAENWVPPESQVPEEYQDASTTPLTAEVEEGGENDFTFELTDG